MNSMQRMMTAMQSGVPDRNPVFAVMGSYASRLSGIPIRDLYRDSEYWVHAQQMVVEQLGIDLALGFFEHALFGEAFGGEVAFFDDQAPNLRRPGYRDTTAFLRSSLPSPLKDGRFPMVMENIGKLRGHYGDTVPVVAAIPGLTALPALIFGMEKWMDTLLFNYREACAVLDKLMPFWSSLLSAIFSSGAHMAFLTEGFATDDICTRELYAEKLHRFVRHSYTDSPGPLIFHHNGGSIMHVMDLVSELMNLEAVSISSDDSISEAREILGKDVTILGNLDNLIFPRNTPVVIQAATKLVCKEGHANAPFILCNSGGDIHIDSSASSLRAFIETGRHYRPNPAAAS